MCRGSQATLQHTSAYLDSEHHGSLYSSSGNTILVEREIDMTAS